MFRMLPTSPLFPYTTLFRSLKRFLGDRFDVRASMGHVRDLPEKEMGVEVEDGFKPHYEVVESRRKTINELRSEEHTSELQSLTNLVCRLLLEKKKKNKIKKN